MRVLHRLAHGDEQLQPRPHRHPEAVAVIGDWDAIDQFHDKEGPAVGGDAAVEYAGDVWMVHLRQGVPLGLEPAAHLLGIDPRGDDLDRDVLLQAGMSRSIHAAHAALADRGEQPVPVELRADWQLRNGRSSAAKTRGDVAVELAVAGLAARGGAQNGEQRINVLTGEFVELSDAGGTIAQVSVDLIRLVVVHSGGEVADECVGVGAVAKSHRSPDVRGRIRRLTELTKVPYASIRA